MKERERTEICGIYDPSTGKVSITFCGDNISACALVGAMFRHIAEEWGRHEGSEDVGFAKTYAYVMDAATRDITDSVRVDLSALHKDKEGDHVQ